MRFSDPARRAMAAQFVRFIASGAINSAATYVLYLVLLRVVPYAVAYTISFAAGVLISFVLNAKWVFRSRATARAAVQFPLVYLFQYALGIVLLAALVEKAGMRREFAPLVVVAFTVPTTFLLSRYVFRPVRGG